MLRTLLARLANRAHTEITISPLRRELPGAADLSPEATITRACSTLRALRQSLATSTTELSAAGIVAKETAGWLLRASSRAAAAERDREALQERLQSAITTGAKYADQVLLLQEQLRAERALPEGRLVELAQAAAPAARERDRRLEEVARIIAEPHAGLARNLAERLQRVLGEAVHSAPPRGLVECEAHSTPYVTPPEVRAERIERSFVAASKEVRDLRLANERAQAKIAELAGDLRAAEDVIREASGALDGDGNCKTLQEAVVLTLRLLRDLQDRAARVPDPDDRDAILIHLADTLCEGRTEEILTKVRELRETHQPDLTHLRAANTAYVDCRCCDVTDRPHLAEVVVAAQSLLGALGAQP